MRDRDSIYVSFSFSCSQLDADMVLGALIHVFDKPLAA